MLAQIKTSDLLFVAAFVGIVITLLRRRATGTKLPGPPSPSYWTGWSKTIIKATDAAPLYEGWATEYGPAFEVALAMGRKRIVLFDPQAVAHFYSRETVNYRLSPISRKLIKNLLGKGIIWSDGDDHKRQRRILSPAFNPSSIREVTSIFFDSAYQAKTEWESMFESSHDNEIIIDVQMWMNKISLDTIGVAGFAHNFQSIAGVHSPVEDAFDNMSKTKPSAIATLFFTLAPIFPILLDIPSQRNQVIAEMSDTVGKIGTQLLDRTRKEAKGMAKGADRSLIGTLVRSEDGSPSNTLSKEEIDAQVKTLIFAGYATSSITLTWILMELAAHPEKQTRLREELSQFGSDLSYDQMWSVSQAPFLDAVVKESLRLHPPVTETTRTCAIDDVIPFTSPVTTASGEKVNAITVRRGTVLTVPISALNCSKIIWGPDASEFKPERWLNDEAGLTDTAKEMQGFHHLLTFIDGPRSCLGKGFAVTEIKAVLSVLVRNFSFAPRDGQDTKYTLQRAVLPRPKLVDGEPGVLPLRVQRVE